MDNSVRTEPFPDLINCRDFGGMKLPDGGRIISDTLFRSGYIPRRAVSGREMLLERDFGTVVDLRYLGERESNPSEWPDTWSERVIARPEAMGEAPHLEMIGRADTTVEDMRRFFITRYIEFLRDDGFQRLLRTGFSRLGGQGGTALIHCSAGKDRTGLVVALLLDQLGASREQVMEDYLLSGGAPSLMKQIDLFKAKAAEYGRNIASDEVIAELLSVREDYLASTLAWVDSEYSSVDGYLAAIGLPAETKEKLAEHYVR